MVGLRGRSDARLRDVDGGARDEPRSLRARSARCSPGCTAACYIGNPNRGNGGNFASLANAKLDEWFFRAAWKKAVNTAASVAAEHDGMRSR